ncbi:MAG: DUF4124 domain-containing protein [Gammaproteobacteria bacterium]|jgi:hypothetical protein|nr:DUF4124 domain-containing protein [Gammaproteobacteria bacterium]
MKKDNLWLVFLCLTLITSPVNAAIYKWQDANGQTHYDQVPPNDVNATQIKSDVKPSSSAKSESDHAQKLIEDLQKQEEKNLEAQKKAEQEAQEANTRAINCEHAKAHLSDLESRVRIRLQDSAANTTQLTPEQRTDEINKTKEAIERFCAPIKPASH